MQPNNYEAQQAWANPQPNLLAAWPKTWTIPNTLTVLRLLAAPGVAIMFLYFHRPWADWLALLEKLPHEVLQASPELQALRQDPLAQMSDRLRQATPMLMGRVAQGTGSST